MKGNNGDKHNRNLNHEGALDWKKIGQFNQEVNLHCLEEEGMS